MSEASSMMISPFLLKRMTNELDIIEINVHANAIKTRKIHLLEWAILAPLSELQDPKPTLEEIGTEFGIEKIEFLEHVANNLTSFGVLSSNYDNAYDITEMGQKLYRKGKMVSDPRNITVPIYYEPHSKEWFVGANDIETREFITRHDEHLINSYEIPEYIPEKLLNKHIKSLKILDKGESVEAHSIDPGLIKITDVELSVFLKNDGLDVTIVKNPFGEEHHNLLKKIFKERLITNGGLKQYLNDYEDAASEFTNIPVKQCHNLGNARIYSLADKKVLVNDILKSEPKWLINSNESAIEYVDNSRKKPEIVVHLNRNSGFDIRTSNSQIIPTSIELLAPIKETQISSGNIVSDQGIASISRIEANGYKIPLYVFEQIDDINVFENEIYHLFSLAEENTSDQMYAAIGKFILRPDEETFNKIVGNAPTKKIKDLESSKKALQEIIGLKKRLNSFDTQIISNAPVYKMILGYLGIKELVSLDINIIFHCRKLYIERFKNIVENDNSKIKDGTWELIASAIVKNVNSYHHVKKLEKKIKNEKNKDSEEILKEIIVILDRFEQNVDQYISKLPKPSKKIEVEEVYKAINDVNPSIKQNYLKRIHEGIEEEIDDLDSKELVEICKFLYKHGQQPKEGILNTSANRRFEFVNWDLLDPKFSKRVISIKNDFKSFDNIFNIDTLINEHFPSNVEIASDKDQIQILFNNLNSLSKAGIVKIPDIKKIIVQEFDLLRNSSNLENTQIGLFLLKNMKGTFAKEKLLDMSSDDIWEYVYPFLLSDKNARKKMEGDLKFLGLKEQLQNFDREQSNENFNSVVEKKENKTQASRLVLDTPPIKRIIIDGSNVARQDSENGAGSIKQLLQAYDDLKNKYGFEDISIIVGAGLRHSVDDFEELQPYIDKKIALQAPAGRNDDEFIIKKSIDKDLLIMTNDLYRDFRKISSTYEKEIQNRRTTYMIDPDDGHFTLQFPDYKELD